MTGLGSAACHEADENIPEGFVAWQRRVTHVAATAPDRFVVARGAALFDVRMHGGRSPYVRGALGLGDEALAMRVSNDGARAYLSGDGKARMIDLRGDTPREGGSHDVARWVERQDGDAVSVWLHQGKVLVAQVAR